MMLQSLTQIAAAAVLGVSLIIMPPIDKSVQLVTETPHLIYLCQDVQDFVEEHNIDIEVTEVGENPNMDPEWKARHYEVTLIKDDEELTTNFSMGLGLEREPDAAEVLESLISDAETIEYSRNFEEWARDLGFDTDSRKAERTYEACKSNTKKLKNFLGDSLYKELLHLKEGL